MTDIDKARKALYGAASDYHQKLESQFPDYELTMMAAADLEGAAIRYGKQWAKELTGYRASAHEAERATLRYLEKMKARKAKS